VWSVYAATRETTDGWGLTLLASEHRGIFNEGGGPVMAERCDVCEEYKDDVESRGAKYKVYRLCQDCADKADD